MGDRKSKWLAHLPTVIWAALCFSGFSILALYANSPSPQGNAASPVPDSSNDGARVTMFLHPKCVCSRASIDELKAAMQQADQYRGTLHFYITVPESGSTEEWKKEPLVTQLKHWGHNSTIHFDPGGKHAEKHGALTSGHVVAHDSEGKLIFTGGITASRGHRGENPGRLALTTALEGIPHKAPSPVYGCGLQTTNAPN